MLLGAMPDSNRAKSPPLVTPSTKHEAEG